MFDFETAEHTLRLFDVARTYLDFIDEGKLVPDEVRAALFAGYDSAARTPLTPEEVAHFDEVVQYTAVACAAWLRNNVGADPASRYLQLAGLAAMPHETRLH